MPVFILVGKVVLLICIKSALIMSLPARTINKSSLNISSIFYKMRENFSSMRVSVRMYQIACVSRILGRSVYINTFLKTNLPDFKNIIKHSSVCNF